MYNLKFLLMDNLKSGEYKNQVYTYTYILFYFQVGASRLRQRRRQYHSFTNILILKILSENIFLLLYSKVSKFSIKVQIRKVNTKVKGFPFREIFLSKM